ncbi:MAG: hypothetical protein ACOVRN_00250 [Flavobacterium sp.]
MKVDNISNLFILFFILMVLGILYRKYEDKRMREENRDNYDAIQKYLLDDVTLGKSKKPILWIHVPYEYNARHWLNFGSRSSFDLNQPYLYLTVRSIIKHCDDSFTICIYDDKSFAKLLPGWNIDMSRLANPILSNIRTLGMMKLLHTYGGMHVPISFVCMKDLSGLYAKGTRQNKMFVCETVDRNATSTTRDFFPNLQFCGAPKKCETVAELCSYLEILTSHDHSAETQFLGQHDTWCYEHIQSGAINLIEGVDIGTKTVHDKQIILDDLMSNHYLDLYKGAYGILIPSQELLRRVHYGWFVRMSPRQVLESDTIIGNYLLLAIGPETSAGILEPLQVSTDAWVGFWKLPSGAPYYGLKPSGLGDHIPRIPYPGR